MHRDYNLNTHVRQRRPQAPKTFNINQSCEIRNEGHMQSGG
jgi:hypothetical protein